MSCVHILEKRGQGQRCFICGKSTSAADEYVIVRLFLRDQGLMVPKGKPENDQISPGRRVKKAPPFVNRKPGLRDKTAPRLPAQGIQDGPPEHQRIRNGSRLPSPGGPERVQGHDGCGFRNKACGPTYSALIFVFLFKERFDMVIPKERYYSFPCKGVSGVFRAVPHSYLM